MSDRAISGRLPCSRGPNCSADGEGGGEGGRLAESSTTKRETEERGGRNAGLLDSDKFVQLAVTYARVQNRSQRLSGRLQERPNPLSVSESPIEQQKWDSKAGLFLLNHSDIGVYKSVVKGERYREREGN